MQRLLGLTSEIGPNCSSFSPPPQSSSLYPASVQAPSLLCCVTASSEFIVILKCFLSQFNARPDALTGRKIYASHLEAVVANSPFLQLPGELTSEYARQTAQLALFIAVNCLKGAIPRAIRILPGFYLDEA